LDRAPERDAGLAGRAHGAGDGPDGARRLRDRLAPEAAQARTLAAALARAETEVDSLRREVEHLKRLAGLPEGM